MLHVLIGASCNNNCVFCMESDRAGRARHVRGQSLDDLRRMIADYPEKDEILFTSGEPTLSQDLPGLIAWASEQGFETIGLISNGRMFAYGPYTRNLVSRGLTKVTLSIHGPDARVHDSLVRTRGAFGQTLAGLEQLRAPDLPRRLDLHTSTVVVRRNLPHLERLIRLLLDRAVDRICLNALMAKGRGASQLAHLMPRYGDLARTCRALGEQLDARDLERISLADVPRCVLEGVAESFWGEQERFDQFEQIGSSGLTGVSAVRSDADEGEDQLDTAAVARLRERASGDPALRADRDYYLTSRELKDTILRIKRPECASCRYDASCPGVWREYVAHFGWEEFEPVDRAE